MSFEKVAIRTKSNIDNTLLTMGLPFTQGGMDRSDELVMRHGDETLPLWWTPRAFWPDGSVKWIFFHTRVPAGAADLVLSRGSEESVTRAFQHEGGVLDVGGCRFEISNGRWTFKTPHGSWVLGATRTETDLAADPAEAPPVIELVEPSPIAPLIRVKPKERTSGLLYEHLFRVDPAAERLIWTQRMTWNSSGEYRLTHSSAELDAVGASFARHEVVAPAPGQVLRGDGTSEPGFPDGTLECSGYAAALQDAWQRAPFGMHAEGERVVVSFYPEQAEPLEVAGGTSYRHTVELACGPHAAASVGSEPDAIIDAAYLSATGALGLTAPASAVTDDFPGYEKAFRATLESGRLTRLERDDATAGPPAELAEETRQDVEYFGLQHYGDWPMPWGAYGVTGRRMYASNEYDPAYAYYQGYAIYEDARYLRIAKASAIHMTDVDMISYSGDMRFHGYGDRAEDHRLARSGGDLGHYWTDGYWMLHFVHGDVWAREAAEAVTGMIAQRFADGGEASMRRAWSGSERSLGWPVVALMGSYEATGDEKLLAAIESIVGYMDTFTADPVKEIEEETGPAENPILWWRTAMADGCKPFMVGVILEGLERFHRVTGSEAAARCIVRLARFLTDVMWLPHQATFIYEWNAYNRGHRFNKPHSLIPLFVRGIGYAYELTGEERFREVSEKAFHACLWTLYDPASGGKSIGMMGRTLGAYVTMIQSWLEEDQRKYRSSVAPSAGGSLRVTGGVKAVVAADGVELTGGSPEYRDGALISQGDSYLSARFAAPVCADAGRLEFRVRLLKGSGGYPGQRCFVHLCGDSYTESALSIISFYSSLHARVYDVNAKLIEVAEAYQYSTDPKGRPVSAELRPKREWREDEWFGVAAEWRAPGEINLYFDGELVDTKPLDRHIGGSFTHLHMGYKPGNWRANALIDLVSLELGAGGDSGR